MAILFSMEIFPRSVLPPYVKCGMDSGGGSGGIRLSGAEIVSAAKLSTRTFRPSLWTRQPANASDFAFTTPKTRRNAP
ncbi:hypothetical protein TWF506_001477 [Arthrobotrys conoides]|uniref:Uncharacterized protein n=1 Tax=Arthrobotrys conoides TaxID=74498 RepID=A0AAN8S1T8_9PEZI